MRKFLNKILFDKLGKFKLDILRSPLFYIVLSIKIIAAFLFASHFLAELFIPFVNYFTVSGFLSPYSYFFELGVLNVFPYPQIMLFVLSVPRILFGFLFTENIFEISLVHLFIYRLPILVADFVIFIILARWLKHKQKLVLYFYWCSPILFYINYLHGQLDVIPFMFLFVFLYLFFKEKYNLSFLFFGLALAAKFHIIILAPFIIIYLFRKNLLPYVLYFVVIAGAIFYISNFNVLFTPEFFEIVFANKEQVKIFNTFIPFGNNLVLYLVPFAYLLLLIKTLSFKNFNRDLFVMFLGFAFSILTLFIPPMPGWYYWILPFLIYFYIRVNNAPGYIFFGLNVLYFAYFFTTQQSDMFEIWQFSFPALASSPNIYAALSAAGLNADLVNSVLFSLLQAALLVNVIWIYQRGIESIKKYKIYYNPYLMGVAGDSGSGKTTLASLLTDVFGKSNIMGVAGDDLHKWERGHEMWSKFTHLNPKANYLYTDTGHMADLANGKSIFRRHYDHNTGTFTSPRPVETKKLIIFEGLHTLYLNRTRKHLDLKVFIKPDEDLRLHWKILRDMEKRGYTKEQILASLKQREEDSREYIQTQADHADIVISLKPDREISSQLGDTEAKFNIVLHLKLSNDIFLENFIQAFPAGIKVNHHYQKDGQILEIEGTMNKDEIERLAYRFMPEIYELNNQEPEWADDHNALIQLFVYYSIFEKMKQDSYGEN